MAVISAGCSLYQSGSEAPPADARGIDAAAPDANPWPDALPLPHECLVQPNWGELGALAGGASGEVVDVDNDGGFLVDQNQSIAWQAAIKRPVDGDDPEVYVFMIIRLEPGRGYFEDGIHPGTFVLSGPELRQGTCSTCVKLLRSTEGPTWQYFFATAGVLTLTSTQHRFIGSVSNLTFVETSVEDPYEPIDSDCTSAISSASFDSEISPPQP